MSAERRTVTHIGGCSLPLGPDDEDVRGHWVEATCNEWSDAVAAAGGLDALRVWSSCTNMEASTLGEPFVFSCWGTRDPHGNPVAADGGHPDKRLVPGVQPCLLDHAVFVAASIDPGAPEQ